MVTKALAGLGASLALSAIAGAVTAGTSTSFLTFPAVIPGTIENENFDAGGEGVAYHDDSSGNTGGVYRQTDVDVAPDAGTGYELGWVSAGEWLKYTVNVARSGNYVASFRVASLGPGGTFHLEVNGANVTGTLAVPDTGGWLNWQNVTKTVALSAGVQVARLVMDSAGLNAVGNFDSMRFAPPLSPPLRLTLTVHREGSVPGSIGGGNGNGGGNSAGSGAPTSYGAISDRIARAEPALPALGPAGFTFQDPTFGSTILRVTDGQTRPGSVNVSYRTPSASPQIAWNTTSTYFYVVSTDGTIVPFSFNPSTMTAARLPDSTSSDGLLALKFYTEGAFSSTDPNVIYGMGGSNNRTVLRYDFSTRSYSNLLNLDTVVSGLSGYVSGVMTGGVPDEKMAVMYGGAVQDLHHYLLWAPVANVATRKILDSTASTINGAPTNVPLNFKLHAFVIDRSGRYILLFPTAADLAAPRLASQTYVWDTTTDLITPTGTALPGGHQAAGYGYSVNHDCCVSSTWDGAQWLLRSLAAPLAPSDLIRPVLAPQEVFLSDHPSWANAQPNVLVPIIVGTYRYGDNQAPWRAWDDEIIAIETGAPSAATSIVWRFAHHRSAIGSDTNPLILSFWYTPRPNVSPDGRWVLFTSNWEKTLGRDSRESSYRQDVFLVRLQ